MLETEDISLTINARNIRLTKTLRRRGIVPVPVLKCPKKAISRKWGEEAKQLFLYISLQLNCEAKVLK